MNIQENIHEVKKELPSNVRLVAVSKFHGVNEILEAYETGHRLFGESRVQELIEKQPELPNDIEWHFVGRLQRNKVKFIVPFIQCIHSVDSERLLLQIERQAAIANRVIPCLLQIHIAEEDTKAGFSESECWDFLMKGKWKELKHIQLAGVMGMATFTEDEASVRGEFKKLNTFFKKVKEEFFADAPYFKEISMGMSSDYKIAIEEGSTLIRVGSNIFGERE
ncbi:MAG TPA: YggS family pyridoxal phosphate-dependent enzyme [Dysgonamonadaceae bacterium]|nr:YggS family pyridoxal phosphate-dependent enzyme [Dysgonamonadaceae bacterium]